MAAYPVLYAVYYLVLFVVVFGTYLNYSANNDISDCYSTTIGGRCNAGDLRCINVTLRWHKLCVLGLAWSTLLWIVLISCFTYFRHERGGRIMAISTTVLVILSFSWMITATIFLYDAPGQSCTTDQLLEEQYFLSYVMSLLYAVYGLIILMLIYRGVMWTIKSLKRIKEKHPYSKTDPITSNSYEEVT